MRVGDIDTSTSFGIKVETPHLSEIRRAYFTSASLSPTFNPTRIFFFDEEFELEVLKDVNRIRQEKDPKTLHFSELRFVYIKTTKLRKETELPNISVVLGAFTDKFILF